LGNAAQKFSSLYFAKPLSIHFLTLKKLKLMKTLLYTLLGLFCFQYAAIGQKKYDVDPFEEISVTGNIHVQIEIGEEQSVKIEFEGLPEDQLSVKVVQGELRLYSINSLLYKDVNVKATITCKNLRSIKANGGANIKSKGEISAPALEIKTGSGAYADLNIRTEALEAAATEGGRLELKGTAESQEVWAATGGQYLAADLESSRAYVRCNTGGKAEVKATELLEITANTGGEVVYYGEPAKKYEKSILGGNVRQAPHK